VQYAEPKWYAVKHTDENIVAQSRSGGIFTALSDAVLAESGVIYGCVMTEDFRAVHIRAEDTQGRDRMRGSKYIESSLGDTLRQVRDDLKAGRKVLFTGTSCQIAGLRRFLGRDWENLLCVDIVCHGVPSPKVWQAYLAWQEKKSKAKVVSANFRNKKDFGWREHMETLTMDDGKVIHSKDFALLFYDHSILRPSCYTCPYKSIMHPGDITIADYWGVEKAAPDFDDNKGVSLVLVNNSRGEGAFEAVKDSLRWQVTSMELSLQPPLLRPFAAPKHRADFWKDFSTKDFGYLVKKYVGAGLLGKIRRKIKSLLGKRKKGRDAS